MFARRLGALPALAACDRRTLNRIAQWGDVLEVPAGEVLARRDRGDFWLFVLLEGSVRCERDGEVVGVVGPGQFFGHDAVVGLRPQQATVIAAERSVVLVLGVRYVVSLLEDSAAFQRAIFPDVRRADYRAFARRMHALGREEWRTISRRQLALAHARAGAAADVAVSRDDEPSGIAWTPPRPAGERAPGRHLSIEEAAALLLHAPAFRLGAAAPEPTTQRVQVPRWLTRTAAGVTAVLAAAVPFTYHPPRAVVTPGRPIDVVGDIKVDGRQARGPSGRYLLLWVHVQRPTLARYVLAAVRGETTVAVSPNDGDGGDPRAAERAGRQQYLDSQRLAIAEAAELAGAGGHHVATVIRDRGFIGPSAGLVYTLALYDMLSGRNCAAGRVIAATGAIETNGKVDPVGWVGVKLKAAAQGRATVLVVPAGERPELGRRAMTAYTVTNVREAVDALCHPAH